MEQTGSDDIEHTFVKDTLRHSEVMVCRMVFGENSLSMEEDDM